MHLYRFDKKKARKIIALSSAFALTISNSLSTVFANNTVTGEVVTTGGIAEPYVPPNAKLDKNNKPVLDEDGNFILLDEEGNVIPQDVLDIYEIKPNSDGLIIHEVFDYTSVSAHSSSTKKLINILSSNINIRSSAKSNASIIGKLPPNSAATLLEDTGSWAKIKYKTITGWVSKDYTTIAHESPAATVKNITTSNVNIRSTNSTSGSVLAKIPAGGTAIAIDSKGGWYKLLYNDTIGWASGQYIKYVHTPNSQQATVKSNGINNNTYVKDKTTNHVQKTSNSMTDSNGRHYYCLDPERLSPNGHPYYKGSTMDDISYRILKFGYPNASFTGDGPTDRVITQMALWGHIDPSRLNINNSIAYRNGAQNSDVLNHIQSLYNKAKSSTNTQTVAVKFSNTNLTANYNGDAFTTDYISLTGSGDIKSATTNLKFFDASSGQQRTDIKAVLEDGKTVSSVTLGQKFRLVIPKSTPQGSIKITGTSDIIHPMAMGYSTNLAGIQDAVTLEDVKETKTVSNNVIVNWNGIGSLVITKIDATSKAKLKGAEFTITNSAGTKVATVTTDANGTATVPSLAFGTYKVQETKAPAGYELDSQVHTVNIQSNTALNVSYTNKQILGSIQITKEDTEDAAKKLQGAEFTLYTSDGKEYAKATSDANGIVKFSNIPVGTYSIKETKAPNGYILDGQTLSATIKSQGQTLKFTVKNSKQIGEVDFSKTDVSTGAIVEGATIEIKGVSDLNKHIKISFVSSKEGNKFKLPVGKYEFKETIAPQGYVLSTEVGTFEIKSNGQVVKANLKNTPIVGGVTITKVDADDTNKTLQGAEFTLYSKDGKEISKATSDAKGIAKFEKMPFGEYVIKETKSPNGYLLVDTPIEVKITEHNKTLTHTITNSKKIGEVDFSKTDVSTGDIIEGATIEIKGIEDANKHINISFVSSKEGNRFKLPVGKYEFKETIAPQGYVLSTEVGTFEIKEHGEIVKANLTNTPIVGSVEILKLASDLPDTIGKEITQPEQDKIVEGNVLEMYQLDTNENEKDSEEKEKDSEEKDSDKSSKEPVEDTEKKELITLKDAEFTLYNKEGIAISTAITDENGIARFDNIPFGEYSIKETKSPNGYVLSDKAIEFKITNHKETLKYSVYNDRAIGEVDFSKTDVSTGDIIEGAIIEIKGIDDMNKDINISFRSSKEGNRLKLPTGKYEFKEITSPDGYILSEEIGTFEIKENGEIVKANLKNTPFTAELKILKVDSKDKKPLTGAEFTLTDKDGKKVHSGVTEKEGILVFSNLKPGTYTLTETKAPNGYLLPEKSIQVEVTTQSKTIELEVENKAKLAQTGGDFTISGLIYTGFTFMILAALLAKKETGGLE